MLVLVLLFLVFAFILGSLAFHVFFSEAPAFAAGYSENTNRSGGGSKHQ